MASTAEIVDAFRWMHHIDKDITLAINACNSPVTDSIWQLFSARAIWLVLYLGIAAFMIFRMGWKKGLLLILACILCVTANDQLANVIKESVQRLRPVFDSEMIARGLHVLEVPGQPYGFYSAHAANTAGFVICSIIGVHEDKKHKYTLYAVLMCLWSLLVGLSRIFVGKHFFGDVCAGFIIGIAIGILFGLLFRLVCAKLIRG
ncbi:MAG: phosphatase PAP2 family protein [Bacteroidales bacterium]|nr:phosphatase PAP2 family protein [Bacteroidales bacterium]